MQGLSYATRVSGILEIDQRVEDTRMADICLIKNVVNAVALRKAQPSTSLGETHFRGIYVLVEHVDRQTPVGGIDTCIQRVEPITTLGSEGATGT